MLYSVILWHVRASINVHCALSGLIQPGAIHLHLAQTQELLSVRDDDVNEAAVHPRLALESGRGTGGDASDHSTPGGGSRNHLVDGGHLNKLTILDKQPKT